MGDLGDVSPANARVRVLSESRRFHRSLKAVSDALWLEVLSGSSGIELHVADEIGIQSGRLGKIPTTCFHLCVV